MSRSLEILNEACRRLPITVRKMFGGHGFFAPNGGMFAGIVTDDEVMLKLTDEVARQELIDEGGHPWTYYGMKKPTTMHDWIVIPDRLYDDGEALATWVKRAHRLVPPKAAKKSPAKRGKKAKP